MRLLAANFLRFAALAAALSYASGCSSHQRRHFSFWQQPFGPVFAAPAEADDAFARAAALEAAGNEACVDEYFRSAVLAWPAAGDAGPHCRIYNAAVAGLVCSSQRFGRLDASRGLVVRQGGEFREVPVVHHGFPWKPSDFQRLHFPTSGREPLLTRRYACDGLGAPLVVERCRDDGDQIEGRFLASRSFFAATVVLRADAESTVLEFHNPHRIRTATTHAGSLPLASDYSAPLSRSLDEAPRTYFAGFVQPGATETAARLSLLEPYQPNRIPIVLIHGLFSDPLSWGDLVNDLRATPGFAEHYQVWYFRYPTGQGFLQSAATLRRELRECLYLLDPERRDPALRQVVLIGHSMGGLIAKLQVTHSEEHVWSRLANRPLAEIVAADEARALLADACYFEPSPDVARVIFIASPHAGSLASSGLIGRGASLLVEPAPATAAIHDQLVRDNPGVFNAEFEDRLPTSIDMLEPKSPLLAAMRHMRIRHGVRLHNILGVSHPVSLDGPSDGVVSVDSAWHPACHSVLAVGAKHARVHRSLEASTEVLRILTDPVP